MSNYIIVPEISDEYVKFGMTEKSHANVAAYLYKRYRTPYGRNMIIYFWCNPNYIENEKIILNKFSRDLCDKSEIIKLTKSIQVSDVLAYCEKIIKTNTYVYSMGSINLSKGYGKVLDAFKDKVFKKELYDRISKEIRDKREVAIEKAIQKEFTRQWDEYINRELYAIEAAKRQEAHRKLAEERERTDKELKKLNEEKARNELKLLELEKKAKALS